MDLSGGIYGRFTDRRLTSRIRSEGPRSVDGRPGYEAIIDIADVDRLHLTPGQLLATLRLVVVRAPGHFTYAARRDYVKFPILVMASSLSAADRAAKHDADFDALVASMRWIAK